MKPSAANVETVTSPPPKSPRTRPWLGYLAVAGVPGLILADATVAYARGWHYESTYDKAIVWALGTLLLAATAFAATVRGRDFYGRRWSQLALLSGGACLAWMVAELALPTLLAQISEPFHCRRPGLEFTYRPQQGVMRDVGPLAHVRFNSWGVRGSEPPAREVAYRILCVGGSSTACTYLDDSRTWPHLLETRLNSDGGGRRVWVGNVGVPSYGTAEHRQFVAQSPLVSEVDCMVVQAGVNDFMQCLAGPQAAPLWTHSHVRQLVRDAIDRYAEVDDRIEDAAGQAYASRRRERSQADLINDLPPLEDCLAAYEGNLRQTIAHARRRQVRIVFTTQPVLWSDATTTTDASLLWFGRLSDGRYLSTSALRQGIDRYNDRLREVCRSEQVELVDLGVLDGESAAFYDDSHFTETGARRVAELVARHIQATRAGTAEGSP